MYLDHTETHGNRGQGLHPINLDKNGIETRESSIADLILRGAKDDVVPEKGFSDNGAAHKLALSGRTEVEEEDRG